MPAYELTGTVKAVMDEMRFDSGFSKREFVVTTDGDRYPQQVKLECVKEKSALLNDVKPGQRVKVSFDLRGNENKGRYFVSLAAWRIEPENDVQSGAAGDDEDSPPLDQLKPPQDDLADDVLPF